MIKSKINEIHSLVIQNILDYFSTGELKKCSPSDFMKGYGAVVDMCENAEEDSEEESEEEVNPAVVAIVSYINSTFKTFLTEERAKIAGLVDIDFLFYLKETIHKIKILNYWLHKVFFYIDRNHLEETQNKSVNGNIQFVIKEEYFEYIKTTLFVNLAEYIERKRKGKDVDEELIAELVSFILFIDKKDLKVDKSDDKVVWTGQNTLICLKYFMDTILLEKTKTFVKEFSNICLHSLSAPEYLNTVLDYIREDEKLIGSTIHETFLEKYAEINTEYFVTSKLEEVLDKETGINSMLEANKIEELSNLFCLATRSDKGLLVLKTKLVAFIKKAGFNIRENKDLIKDPRIFITKLIEMKAKFDKIAEDAFQNTRMLSDAQNSAFMSFMSKGDLVYKQLASYSNFQMRQGTKTDSESMVNKKIDDIIGLFNCLSNKMLYIREHFKFMSERLLKKKSVSIAYESKFVNSLKAVVGASDVQKLISMLQDLKSSENIMNKFRQRYRKGDLSEIDFNTMIVQNNCWNIDETAFQEIKVPAFIEDILSKFSQFYAQLKTNLQLTFAYSKADVEVVSKCFTKKYVINMSLPQYLVFYHIEKHGSIKGEALKEAIGIGNKQLLTEIYFLLWGMYNPKKTDKGGMLLTSGKAGEEPCLEDEFTLNKDFKPSTLRISCLPVPLKSRRNHNDEEKKAAEEKKNLRKFMNDVIDSTLVRIMKGRKDIVTNHQELVNEANSSISLFNANPQNIKERIESLIERKILKRNDNNRDLYEYIS